MPVFSSSLLSEFIEELFFLPPWNTWTTLGQVDQENEFWWMECGQELHWLPPGLVVKPVKPPSLSPLLSLGLGVRSSEIPEDKASSRWKDSRPSPHCLEEVSTGELPGWTHSRWTSGSKHL